MTFFGVTCQSPRSDPIQSLCGAATVCFSGASIPFASKVIALTILNSSMSRIYSAREKSLFFDAGLKATGPLSSKRYRGCWSDLGLRKTDRSH